MVNLLCFCPLSGVPLWVLQGVSVGLVFVSLKGKLRAVHVQVWGPWTAAFRRWTVSAHSLRRRGFTLADVYFP